MANALSQEMKLDKPLFTPPLPRPRVTGAAVDGEAVEHHSFCHREYSLFLPVKACRMANSLVFVARNARRTDLATKLNDGPLTRSIIPDVQDTDSRRPDSWSRLMPSKS
ncbi:hypothetical protein CIHG_04083 [Coccidioides immitis H538.4]|uniref:Uncharacterized protein n=3 Tax=Coccidioides immitis TaxID=5501 RepID=A0A0J8TG30_COCIT|nr:hypothetical protein CIRG_04481 [Coccidioides immitis RMSCC 2394]KMU72577.1 hypothetical protein CISG_09693 [Coccidioides immitis RMSCC 3703]KMU86295.1 hypothetical protein CIHG_04083 [Coccidioides immitis H538.4]